MRHLIILLTCLALPLAAEEWRDEDLPRHIRIITEYIEVPHELVTKVMVSKDADSGPKLHARMRALVKDKKARILETTIVSARPGQRAIVESIGIFMSPTEYDIEFPPSMKAQAEAFEQRRRKARMLRPEWPTASEMRNVGISLEIEPNVGPKNKVIDLRFAPELSTRLRLETWVSHKDRWGDASVRRPTYESLKMRLGVTLLASEWGFCGLLTPNHPDGGRDTTKKIMLFVRADLIPIEHPDTWKP